MTRYRILIVALGGAAFSAQAVQTPGPLPFVACPIVQDTPSVPCWIVETGGETYYLGIQSDVSAPFNPPALGHKVLVEGSVKKDAPRICGGLVVDPVTVSIMPELSPECDELRQVDPRYNLPFDPPRPLVGGLGDRWRMRSRQRGSGRATIRSGGRLDEIGARRVRRTRIAWRCIRSAAR